jgi:hypothetical protein
MDGQHNLGLQVPSGEWSKMMAEHMSLAVMDEPGHRARDASCLVALTAACPDAQQACCKGFVVPDEAIA